MESAENKKLILEGLVRKACENRSLDFETLRKDAGFNLVQNGVYDSFDFLEFITSLESELGIEIDFFQYNPEEFTNYHRLLEIISGS